MKIREMTPSVFKTNTKRPWYRRGIFEQIGWAVQSMRRWSFRAIFRPENHIRIKALTRTDYRDIDTKMFEGCFQLLLDYVEKELAHMHLMTTDKLRWYHEWFPNLMKYGAENGIAHLDWEINLGEESPQQAEAAAEIKRLYLWYTVERPNRFDPWDEIVDGVDDVTYTDCNDGTGSAWMNMSEEYSAQLEKAGKVDDAYELDDTAQFEALIKVRHCMWT